MKMWAESKNLPGQFTGSTGVQVLSQAELAGTTDPKKQAWGQEGRNLTSCRVDLILIYTKHLSSNLLRITFYLTKSI